MRTFNKTTVYIQTVLFILLLAPFIFNSCKQSGENNKKVVDKKAAAASADSLSIQTLSKQIRENPKSPELFAKRAGLYATSLNYNQALNDITIALSLDSTKPAYFINQSEYYMFTGEPNSAKKALNTCLKKHPANTDAMLKLAEIHLYLKEYGQSKQILQQVAGINNDLGQIYFLQALIAVENKDTTSSIRSFQLAIEKDPDFYAAYIEVGKLYSMKKDPLAVQYLKSAIDLQPKMYEAHYLLGMYYQENNQLSEAFQEYDYISTQIDSTLADPYFNRGYIELIYKSNYEEAAKWFGKAISCNPKMADAWYNRGFSYELAGKLSEAKADYKKTMEIQPNYSMAIKGLNRIENGTSLKRR